MPTLGRMSYNHRSPISADFVFIDNSKIIYRLQAGKCITTHKVW